MDVLKKFTTKNIKLNKKRTIVTIIGIMLSTALLCAVSGMVTSTQETLINYAKQHSGNYHVVLENVPSKELKYIEQNNNVEKYFTAKVLGYSILEGSGNPDKPYAYVCEYSKETLENTAITLVEGRMPENANEVVIPNHMINNGEIDIKVGDKITLNIGKRQTLEDKEELNQQNPYLSRDYNFSDTINFDEARKEGIEEEIVNTITKTYDVVGIIERPSYIIENFQAPGYTIISYLEENEEAENVNVYITYNNPTEYKDITENIIETIETESQKNISYETNSELLRYQGAVSESTLSILYSIAGIVIAIIVISSVFVIRNSFAISVSEKTRQYGMLISVGATRKQIKKSVILEGMIIGVIAIPLGIVCGIIAIIILLQIVNILLATMAENLEFVYSVPFAPILISIVISFITIYLSCIIPARRASKISPIEAIRGNEDIKIKSKKIKTSKLTKKIFGIGGVIASKNIKRNKKKYRTTVISLVVSVSIFIALSSFLEYGRKMTTMYYTELGYNISIYGGNEETYKEIMAFDGIEKASYSYQTSASIDIEKYGDKYKEMLKEKNYSENETFDNRINLVLLDREYFKEFVKELGLDASNYKNIAIIEDDEIEYLENGSKKINYYYDIIKEGDKVTLTVQGKEREITITKRTQTRPIGYESSYSNGGWLFVSEDFIDDKTELYTGNLNVQAKDATKLENKIVNLAKQNEQYESLGVTNFEKYNTQNENLILLISIFLYGFIAVITLIGVTNIFNTITTNMILRSKEFANLKSIGMTSKEFNKMIRLESILYGLKSLAIGIPIGLIGSYFIYQSFAGGIDFGYIIPWAAILISIIFVFIIVGTTMKYSLNKINKQNIIETIRKDNI